MKTDDLIEALSRNLEPAKPKRAPWGLAWRIAAGFGLGALGLVAALGVRPDIGTALAPVLAKAAFSALAATAILPAALALSSPGRPVQRAGLIIAALLAACAVAVGVALIGEAPEARMKAWTGGGFPWCLVLIPILATPAAALLTWWARGRAPTRLALAGASIGGLSGGVGAMVYAMYCPVDSTAFVATWYAAGIGISAGIGALLGSRLLRW